MSMNGIKFNDIHSYYDLNLILSKCSISPAKPKTNYIDIPGADDPIDLTEAFGSVNFNGRTGQLIFTVLPGDDFEEKKSEISNLLNGVYFDKITLDKDPDYYYQGRCSINDWKCDKTIGQITVDLKLKTWKLKQDVTSVTVSGDEVILNDGDVVLLNGKMPVVPSITSTIQATIIFGDYAFDVGVGTYKFPELCLTEGENIVYLQIDPGGNLIFTYQEGSL